MGEEKDRNYLYDILLICGIILGYVIVKLTIIQVNKQFCELKGKYIGIAQRAKETRSGML